MAGMSSHSSTNSKTPSSGLLEFKLHYFSLGTSTTVLELALFLAAGGGRLRRPEGVPCLSISSVTLASHAAKSLALHDGRCTLAPLLGRLPTE